ncbi:hypothetical protein JW777_03555, partial [bacterium]|nr:hypothetical protein [bacterium]
MDYQTVYFENPGPGNTDETLRIAGEWSDRLGLRTILTASTSGATGVEAAGRLAGRDVIVVSHVHGFLTPDESEMLPDNRRKIESAGGRVLTCQHAFGGIGRAVRIKFGTYEVEEIIANALRTFGQGVKVAVETALMAADAGWVRTDRDIIAVGGTGSGADTALVLRPANVSRFFDLRIRGILCKPWNF